MHRSTGTRSDPRKSRWARASSTCASSATALLVPSCVTSSLVRELTGSFKTCRKKKKLTTSRSATSCQQICALRSIRRAFAFETKTSEIQMKTMTKTAIPFSAMMTRTSRTKTSKCLLSQPSTRLSQDRRRPRLTSRPTLMTTPMSVPGSSRGTTDQLSCKP